MFRIPSPRQTPSRPAPRRCRPRLEALEDRTLPATLTVGSLNPTELRTAIAAAQDGDTVTFATGLTGTVNLTTGELAVQHSIAIVGPGAGQLTIDAGDSSRIFNIPAASTTVSISGLTLSHGRIAGSALSTAATFGGAITNAGTLTVSNCTFSNDTAPSTSTMWAAGGGAIYSGNALTVTGCTFDHCTGEEYGAVLSDGPNGLNISNCTFTNDAGTSASFITRGGAVAAYNTLSVSNSSFIGNSAYEGGAVYGVNAGTAPKSIAGSYFANNTAAYIGGAILNDTGDGSVLTVTGSTLANNTANFGGAVLNFFTLNLVNSTVAGNTGSIAGGGIYNAGTTLTLSSVTVAGNTVPVAGTGGAGLYLAAGTMTTLQNTIVAGNLFGAAASDIFGTVASASSYNLIGTGGAGGLVDGSNHNLVGVANPGLGTLDYYGGSTPTIPLLPGSPAITAGDPSLVYTDDQRGFRRGPTASIGASQYVPGNAAYFQISVPATVTAGVSFSVTVTALDAYGNVATGFTGPVVLHSTDPQAPDLGSYEYTAADGGSHTFDVTLFSAPDQQLLALTHAFVGVAEVTVQET